MLISSMIHIVPVVARRIPIENEMSRMIPTILLLPNRLHIPAVSFSKMYCTPIVRNGTRQMAMIARIPYTPAAFFIIPVLTRIASDASDMIPPTTGTVPEIASFAAFSAAASVVPLITFVIPRYPVKIYIQTVQDFSPRHSRHHHPELRISGDHPGQNPRSSDHRCTQVFHPACNQL